MTEGGPCVESPTQKVASDQDRGIDCHNVEMLKQSKSSFLDKGRSCPDDKNTRLDIEHARYMS